MMNAPLNPAAEAAAPSARALTWLATARLLAASALFGAILGSIG